jgi:hypothetical protein
MKMRQHDVAKRVYCRAGRASAAIATARALCFSFMVNAALRRGTKAFRKVEPAFGKDHARTTG